MFYFLSVCFYIAVISFIYLPIILHINAKPTVFFLYLILYMRCIFFIFVPYVFFWFFFLRSKFHFLFLFELVCKHVITLP